MVEPVNPWERHAFDIIKAMCVDVAFLKLAPYRSD